MSVSVVMVSYHTGPVLGIAVASVLQQQGLTELLLVDNGNPPTVLAQMQQQSLMDPRLKVITGHGNIGFSAGCNRGVKEATGSYVLLLNPDCILPPGALATLANEIERLPNTALAGVHLLNPDGSEQRGGRRELLTPSRALMQMLGLKAINRHHLPMPEETHDVPAISGACMFTRKADYEALGGLDEGFFLHVEDLDFCMRVAKAGKRIVCVPKVKVAHVLSTSGETRSSFVERHKAKGFVRYFDKHFKESAFPGLLQLINSGIMLRYSLRKYKPLRRGKQADASRRLMVLASSLITRQNAGTLSGKTVLVTGATSQIGVFVIKHLLAAGVAVLAVSREEPLPFSHRNLKWLRKDITTDDFTLDGFLADVAIHCAPIWLLPKIMPVLAASDVKRLVAIGSTSVFSKALSNNPFEKELVAKHTRAEQELASAAITYNIGWTILRPTMVYGAGLDKNIASVAHFIEKFGFFPVYPPAMGRRQPVHAEDVAVATLQAVTSEITINKSYNVSGADILTYREMLERIFNTLRQRVNIRSSTMLPLLFGVAGLLLPGRRHVTRDVALRMNEDLVFFHDDASRDFTYTPRGFLTGGMSDIEGMLWRE